MKSGSIRLTFKTSSIGFRMLARNFKTEILPLSNKLLRFAIQILQDEEEAKDVLQDTFLKLWQKRGDLERVENLEAFACRMVRNRCMDVIRSRRTTSLEVIKRSNMADEEDKVSEYTENAETVDLVKQIIAGLPDLQREIIHLRDVQQMEYDEIAEITRLNVNAIRVNLSRARKKVRDEILKIQNYGITKNTITAAKVL